MFIGRGSFKRKYYKILLFYIKKMHLLIEKAEKESMREHLVALPLMEMK